MTDWWQHWPDYANWLWIPLTLHCGIGIAAAIVARQKGLNFKRWLLWGIIGGTPALIMAWRSRPTR